MDPLHRPAGSGALLDILGTPMRIHVAAPHCEGAFSLFEEWTPAGGGPSLHIHHNEEEFFRVVEGSYLFRVGEQTIEAAAGDCLLVPRGTPHTFFNAGSASGCLFMGFNPGGAERFFQRISDEKLTPAKDMRRIALIGDEHGLEFLGPNPFAKP